MLAVPLLLGHRGARALSSVVENTVSAFDFALQHGGDGFEFDVRLTRDNVAVVCHDAKSNGLLISQSTAAQHPHLPRVEDVMARFANRAFLDIELKVAGMEQMTLAALQENPPKRGFVVSSFLPQILVELRNRDPAIPLGFICDEKKTLQRWRELPVDYVIPHHSLITPKLVTEISDVGKKIIAWTVNSKTSMLHLAGWGVHGIISDKPELLVRTLRTAG
jgi:glycerophosphoryl diester phosphodiesterase